MRETGIVKSVSGSLCEVSVKRTSACGENCATCSAGCKAEAHICVCKNTAGARVGDRVYIEMDTSKVLTSAFLIYILPLALFIAAFLLLSNLSAPARSLISVATAVISLLLLGIYSKKHKNNFLPSVTEILPSL